MASTLMVNIDSTKITSEIPKLLLSKINLAMVLLQKNEQTVKLSGLI